jgi:phosphoenolpyruvate carboxylase
VFRRLSTRLRVDALKLHRLLALIPDEAPLPDREHTRRMIGVLRRCAWRCSSICSCAW